jgi:hypothetical protein
MEIAGGRITSDLPFEIYYYSDGEFVCIVDAYKNGALTDENVADIVEYHRNFEENTGFNLNNNN